LEKLSKSWPKFKLCSFHKMLEKLFEGQKDVPRVRKIYVL
jgi:hypothetical protein